MVEISRFVRFVKPVRSASLRSMLTTALMLTAPSVAMAQYTYVNSNNQTGQWNNSARWSGGPAGTFPNAIDATATLNPPLSNAPSGNYNVQLSNTAGQSITIGSLTVNNSDLNPAGTATRIGANGNGTLTFQVSSGSASYTENAAANGNTNIFAPVTFASDTIITQNQGVDTANSGTQFSSTNNSPGGVTAAPGITVTKQGAGNINFTVPQAGPGTGFQGNLVINQGGVRVEENVFTNAASVTVNNGGQLQLGTGAAVPNWNLSAPLTLNGPGKATGINPEGSLRYQSNNATGSLNAAVNLASDSTIFVNANLAPVEPNPVTYGHLNVTGAVSGAGGLTKSGSGVLELSAANSYEGATVINAGTLLATNTTGSATGNGPVTVNAGAALGGSGTIAGSVTFAGGILAPGSSPNTLTLGSTTLDSLTTLIYELATPGVVGSGINDLTVVNGNLSLDGLLNVTDVGGFGIGTYRLFDYTGSLTDNGLDIGTAPAGFHYAIDTSSLHQVNLTVTAVPEPSTFALVALGGVILGGVRVIRRRQAGRME